MMSDPTDPHALAESDRQSLPINRPIRSFVVRAGRMSPRQTRGLTEGMSRYGVPFAPTTSDWSLAFSRDAPLIFEIGFGMGQTTAEIAAAQPQTNFIGVEVHPPGVGNLCNLLDERRLENVRVIQHDAVEVLTHMIAPNSLAGVHIYFPDPWHKKRHNKRRLIQPPLVALIASRLREGGYLHLATDWVPYAEQMLEVLRAEPQLKNTAVDFCQQPSWRTLTKFENRGINLGHEVRDLLFVRPAINGDSPKS
jgi:tRNA (guanine-N7-)-methyltransferase